MYPHYVSSPSSKRAYIDLDDARPAYRWSRGPSTISRQPGGLLRVSLSLALHTSVSSNRPHIPRLLAFLPPPTAHARWPMGCCVG